MSVAVEDLLMLEQQVQREVFLDSETPPQCAARPCESVGCRSPVVGALSGSRACARSRTRLSKSRFSTVRYRMSAAPMMCMNTSFPTSIKLPSRATGCIVCWAVAIDATASNITPTSATCVNRSYWSAPPSYSPASLTRQLMHQHLVHTDSNFFRTIL